MIANMTLPFEAFREIGMQATGPDTLGILDKAHRSRQYLLMRMVVDRLPPGARTNDDIKSALDLLAEVQRTDRRALDTVLTYPHVGSGLVRCLQELDANGDVRAAGRYIATVAAAAAFLGEVDFDLGTTSTATLHIPATGTAHVGGSGLEVRLRQRAGHRTVGSVALPHPAEDRATHWSGVRPLDTRELGDESAAAVIVLDDLDPNRGAGGLLAAGRLSSSEFAVWRDMVSAAFTRLRTVHPGWTQQIRQVIRTLTPLSRQRPNQGRSASTWQAYGAVAMTLPSDDLAMAATLVHELQHSKLNMLMTMIDLFDRADRSWHYSPWRADPRPVHGLLHGCYAFLGMAAFWSAERAAGTGARAEYEFALAELQLRLALEDLDDAGGLTADGREFVECLAERLKELGELAGPTPDSVRHLAELSVDDHRVSWRLRSMAPDPAKVSIIASAWRAGHPIRPLPTTSDLVTSMETFVPNERIRLWRRLAGEPIAYRRDPDVLLARRAFDTAAQRYTEAIGRDHENADAWTGLALAAARLDGPARQLWHHRPELIRAVHRAVCELGGEPPDPCSLAEWLAAG